MNPTTLSTLAGAALSLLFPTRQALKTGLTGWTAHISACSCSVCFCWFPPQHTALLVLDTPQRPQSSAPSLVFSNWSRR